MDNNVGILLAERRQSLQQDAVHCGRDRTNSHHPGGGSLQCSHAIGAFVHKVQEAARQREQCPPDCSERHPTRMPQKKLALEKGFQF